MGGLTRGAFSGRRRRIPVGEFEAEVVDLAHDGRGVAKIDGKVIFIADALPGERVRFHYVASHHDVDEGQMLAVSLPSPDRVEPKCRHYGVCGGCALQHLAPAAQVAFKQKQMLDALARIGKLVPERVAAPLTGPVWDYRRRARLGVHFERARGQVAVGFRQRAGSKLASLSRCEVLDRRVGDKLPELAAMVAGLSLRARIPQIEVACSDETVALVFRVLAPPTDDDRARLAAFGAVQGFAIYLQTGGPGTVAPLPGISAQLNYSPDGGDDRLHFEPTDFIQVNGAISQAMVRQAMDWLDAGPAVSVLELFCGLGNFSLPLARRGATVTAIEGDEGLVARARANAAAAGLAVNFHRADLFKSGAAAPWAGQPFDAVLLDPPRAGAVEVLPTIAAIAPQRIVYVSCHPGTLARDAGILVHEHGYRLVQAGAMDMFPHTAHIESMALFERAAKRR